MKKFFACIFIFLAAVSCSDKPQKKIMIGLVNFIVGDVVIISSGNIETKAKIGMPLDAGMKIRVRGKSSICEIYIGENAIKIFGDSLVSIATLSFDKKDKTEKTSLVLDSGRAFFRIKSKLMKSQTFEVRTQTCTAAVRGTKFFVSETGSSSAVKCLGGKVEVSGKNEKKPVTIGKNEKTVTKKDRNTEKSEINEDEAAALEKDSEIKPITDANKNTFDGIDEGDSSALSGMRKKLRSLSSTSDNVKEDKDVNVKDKNEDKNNLDMFFFKSKN